MLTVAEAAKRIGRSPATVRRWIRSGKLMSVQRGTQYWIEERDLEPFEDQDESMPIAGEWLYFPSGKPQPDWVKVVRRSREGH